MRVDACHRVPSDNPFLNLCTGRSLYNGTCRDRFGGRPFSSTGPKHCCFMPTPKRFARVIMDGWFKRTFGTENHKRLLHLFLQELLPERHIVNLKLENTEHVNPIPGKKDIRVDVECYDEDGTRFVVEMQVADQEHFYERAVFNSSFAILQQKKKGELDYDFPTVYVVGLMNFSRHPDGQVDYRYMLRENNTGEPMTDRLQYILLELPNSVLRAQSPEATVLDKFCFALYQMDKFTERPAEFKEEIFNLLFDYTDFANFTPEEKLQYELDMTTEADRINQLKYAEKKGREEKAREMARAFLKLGVPAETVAQGTGLSLEEVLQLVESE